MRVFKEEQRFTQTWIITLLTIQAVIAIIFVSNEFLKSRNRDITEYFGTLAIILAATGLIFLFKLRTRIDEVGIHYQFFPFHLKLKTIFWRDIETAKTRNYNAFSEYGGYGVKGTFFGKKIRGIAINVSGNTGIQLKLKNGKKILIGTLKKNDANTVINRYFNKN
ncbi:hypothetical protein [Algibacter sp. L4_22]|uniref:hypothetical protein n=1 Tax=Algibacter sp. L4_22 TaxID=2942477 RepID=UPI00201B614A|nr:hypothetical protein [Algibacter sp. L4_22]MCL5128719.1 hypothetical protein [Algibacter sp. L4_22]